METSNHSGPASAQHARAGGKVKKSTRASGPPCYIGGLSTNQFHKGAAHGNEHQHRHQISPCGARRAWRNTSDSDASPPTEKLCTTGGCGDAGRLSSNICSRAAQMDSCLNKRDAGDIARPCRRARAEPRELATLAPPLQTPVAHGGDAGRHAGGQGFRFDSGLITVCGGQFGPNILPVSGAQIAAGNFASGGAFDAYATLNGRQARAA